MANHFESIGFRIFSMEDVFPVADKIVRHNALQSCGKGIYWRLPVGSGAEVWLHTGQDKSFQTMVPHFAGEEAGKVRIEQIVPGDSKVPLVGGYHVWAGTDDAESVKFPFVFEAPDPLLTNGYVGEVVPVQLTAFIHEARCFKPEAYADAKSEVFLNATRMARRSFIPTGLFPKADADLTDKAMCTFSGEILDINRRTNSVTGLPYLHARIATLELTIDVVGAPDALGSMMPQIGDIVQVYGWLSGRILLPPKEAPKPGFFKRLLGW